MKRSGARTVFTILYTILFLATAILAYVRLDATKAALQSLIENKLAFPEDAMADDAVLLQCLFDRMVWLLPVFLLGFCAIFRAIMNRGKNWWLLIIPIALLLLFTPYLEIHASLERVFNEVFAGPNHLGEVSLFWLYALILLLISLIVIRINGDDSIDDSSFYDNFGKPGYTP